MPTNTWKSRPSIYETITEKLLAAIDAGPGDPVLPWQRAGTRLSLPHNAVTGQTYRGVNILSLWVTALDKGFTSSSFATLRQWNSIGATVRRGEAASPIMFYREIEKADAEPTEDAEAERIVLARGYWVFAAEQVEGYALAPVPTPSLLAKDAVAEAYFAATGARLAVGGTIACYRPSTDTIHMPDEARFIGTDGRSR